MTIADLAVVVVHHRSYGTLPATFQRLLAEGVEPGRLLVVDNSEDPDRQQELKDLLPAGAHAIFCENSGYGAAVNRGAAWHGENTAGWKHLLVSTHETRPYNGCLAALRAVLVQDPRTAVVGPVLLTGENGQLVWSTGGYLTPVLGLPRHHAHLVPQTGLPPDGGTHEVSWLDGALLMFRREILQRFPIDERFFLYMEETDHHQGLLRHGWKVKVCTEALAWQHSDGVPPYYLARNVQLFHAKNGSRFQLFAAAPYLIAHAAARDFIKRPPKASWLPMLRGYRAGRKLIAAPGCDERPRMTLVNPLGGALMHYTAALRQHLLDAGMEVDVLSVNEPSVSGQGRVKWLLDYAALLAKAGTPGKMPGRVLVTWPVLGFWDLLLVRVLCGSSAAIVYHDPKPLVRATGSSPAVSRLVKLFGRMPATVVHSTQAALTMSDFGLADTLTEVAHPIRIEEAAASRQGAGQAPELPRVRVLGQYKPDRDIHLLESLAVRLGATCHLEIVGRGWPPVEGWQVDARFVSEAELDHLIETSAAVVIPYKRFFQSGIAIRALEHAVPIVGRWETSLRDIYGPASQLLVREGSKAAAGDIEPWVKAIEFALESGRAEAGAAAESFHKQASAEWTRFAESLL